MACLFVATGCATTQIRDGIFSPSHGNYAIHVPNDRWEPIRLHKEDITLWNKQYNASIAIISTDRENKKSSLELFANRLFIGMQNKRIVAREPVLINDYQAIRTILTGEIDNFTLKIDSFIIKTDKKVYDLVYWVSPEFFHYLHDDFLNMIKTFKLM